MTGLARLDGICEIEISHMNTLISVDRDRICIMIKMQRNLLKMNIIPETFLFTCYLLLQASPNMCLLLNTCFLERDENLPGHLATSSPYEQTLRHLKKSFGLLLLL